jgi:DNA (cytosine-5)-methyltransferase 1
MIYGSVCSGIEAATVAWHPLGWHAAWFSEIEDFPKRVLAYHYPDTPDLGDMTTICTRKNLPSIDLLVGGTPCQSFSVAGERAGLDDARGNLALEFCKIARALKPRWIVWENVAGILSSNNGEDFGTVIGEMAKCGYGIAYRVLDAKYFGVPQTRRRVYTVGYLGDWRRPAAVLFEPEMLQGNPATSKNPEQKTPPMVQGNSPESGPRFVDVYNHALDNGKWTGLCAPTVTASFGLGNAIGPKVLENKGVRKLMPIEGERLMGFPPSYTDILGAKDAARYKAIGNSMVVPVMRWIGERIQAVESKI